jgi:hypothetical protein
MKFDIGPLVNEIYSKYPPEIWKSSTTTFLDPDMAGGQFVTPIEAILRVHGHSDENIKRRVFGIQSGQMRVNYAVNKHKLVGTYMSTDFLLWETDMKFDVIAGNPPYQKKVGPTKTEPIWDKFVLKSFELLKEDGYLSLIHPAGWRNIEGRYKNIQNLIKNKNLLYLKMYSESAALDIFGVNIVLDYYVLQNRLDNNSETTIITHDGNTVKKNLSELEFIPNKNIDELFSLIATDDEPTVEIIHSWSAYETRKPYMSEYKDSIYRYPCVCNVNKSEECTLMYSSTNKNGHFGISKLICGSASSGTNFFIDEVGEYGITQFSFAIVELPENLKNLKTAMKSERFQEIIKAIPNFSNAINFKILSLFRKDFWKEFV